MASKDNSPEKQPSKEKAKGAGRGTLPVLVEFTITMSVIILVIVFFSMVGISLLTGAKLLDIVLRTSLSLILVGLLLLFISRQIISDVMNPGSPRKADADGMGPDGDKKESDGREIGSAKRPE